MSQSGIYQWIHGAGSPTARMSTGESPFHRQSNSALKANASFNDFSIGTVQDAEQAFEGRHSPKEGRQQRNSLERERQENEMRNIVHGESKANNSFPKFQSSSSIGGVEARRNRMPDPWFTTFNPGKNPGGSNKASEVYDKPKDRLTMWEMILKSEQKDTVLPPDDDGYPPSNAA